MSEEPRIAAHPSKSGPPKNSALLVSPPGSFHLYLFAAALAAAWAWWNASDAGFFVALGLLALAELTVMRRAWELCAARARNRMSWPPAEPPLRDGASQEEIALAWADIAARLSASGQGGLAAIAWTRVDAVLAEEGRIP